VGFTLQHVRGLLPCPVRLIARGHPLRGQEVMASGVYGRQDGLWLVVTLPDGGDAGVPLYDTDLVPEPVRELQGQEAEQPGGTVLSIEGVRRLRLLMEGLAGGGVQP
jgi:hypothetical protein